jgi:hypothetical protein
MIIKMNNEFKENACKHLDEPKENKNNRIK